MKINKNNQKRMSAMQFMRSFEETQNIMESIANKTAHEQKAMMESIIDEQDYTDDEGVFNMGNMLDVEIADGEDMQPKYYNTPVEDLTDGDKALIVNEFTKMLMDMHEEVIDFSDIGPVATVIQNRFGFKQDVEGFLRDTITKASDWQQSQVMSHENETAGEEIAGVAGAPVQGGDAPTDIAPKKAGTTGGDIPPMGGDVPPVAAPVEIIEEPDIDPIELPEEPIEGLDIEPTIDEAPVDDLDAEPVIDTEDTEEVIVPEETEEGEETEESEEGEETEESEEGEETEESEEDEEEEEKKDIDLQLESIRAEYMNSKKVDSLVEDATQSLTAEAFIDAQLESIRTTLVEEVSPAVETDVDDEEAEIQAYLNDIMQNDKGGDITPATDEDIDAAMNFNESVIARLESISAGYHAKENAKARAIKKEKQLNATLESISAGYHNTLKQQAIAEAKEAELDDKLNGLVESYQNSKKANLTARQATRKKIEEMNG